MCEFDSITRARYSNGSESYIMYLLIFAPGNLPEFCAGLKRDRPVAGWMRFAKCAKQRVANSVTAGWPDHST